MIIFISILYIAMNVIQPFTLRVPGIARTWTTTATNYIVLTFQFNFVGTFKVEAAAWAADEKLLNIFFSFIFFGSMFAYNSCSCCCS